MTSTLATAILKNIDAENATTGVAVMALIMAEANRREHLAGAVQSVQWDRTRGIGVLVDDAGHRQHLANALSLGVPKDIFQVTMRGLGHGEGRQGVFAGFHVTVWNMEP